MLNYSFNHWLSLKEWANFGFDQLGAIKNRKGLVPEGDLPLQPLKLEYITDRLKNFAVGFTEADVSFINEITWGQEPGAVKLIFSPLGGLRATIKRKCHDLCGESRWICKKIIEIRHIYDEHPDKLVHNITNVIKELSGQQLDSPSREYKGLERLALKLSINLRQIRKDLFVYEGLKKVKPNEHYIIHFGLHGYGVQAPGQRRVNEFLFDMNYDETTGLIKIIGQEVGNSIAGYDWELEPSQWIEYYMPSQNEQEIIESQMRLFHSF